MVLFLLTAVILVLLVLIQKGRGGGLAGAFGGPGGHSAFGTKTADVFIKATAVVGGIFFVLSILTAWVMRPTDALPPEKPKATSPAEPGGAADTPATDENTGTDAAADQPAASPGSTKTDADATAPAAGTPAGETKPAP